MSRRRHLLRLCVLLALLAPVLGVLITLPADATAVEVGLLGGLVLAGAWLAIEEAMALESGAVNAPPGP